MSQQVHNQVFAVVRNLTYGAVNPVQLPEMSRIYTAVVRLPYRGRLHSSQIFNPPRDIEPCMDHKAANVSSSDSLSGNDQHITNDCSNLAEYYRRSARHKSVGGIRCTKVCNGSTWIARHRQGLHF